MAIYMDDNFVRCPKCRSNALYSQDVFIIEKEKGGDKKTVVAERVFCADCHTLVKQIKK